MEKEKPPAQKKCGLTHENGIVRAESRKIRERAIIKAEWMKSMTNYDVFGVFKIHTFQKFA